MSISQIQQNIDHVIKLCKDRKIQCENNSDLTLPEDDILIGLSISLQSGKEIREFVVIGEEDLNTAASIPFYEYKFIQGMEAIINVDRGLIEALLIGSSDYGSINEMVPLLHRLNLIVRKGTIFTLKNDTNPNLPIIAIGGTSKTAKMLLNTFSPSISIHIGNVHFKNHDEALNLLTTISNSILFEIEIQKNVLLTLKRTPKIRSRVPDPLDDQKISYPKNTYDSAPMALYWYAASASNMPLLQFLAFYQVIEYFFPQYHNADLTKRLRILMKNPRFNIDNDSEVSSIISFIKTRGNNASERDQLKSTIKECVFDESIESFMSSDDVMARFFSQRASGISTKTINLQNKNSDLCTQLAERIYDIRCKIVHTKGDSYEAGSESLLPFSPEAGQLENDIKLIKFISQRVLISASRTFQI